MLSLKQELSACSKWWTSPMSPNLDIGPWTFVKTHVKFRRSLVKSGSVSNVEHGMKPGGVRCELNLCVGSPVTEAYGKSDDVSELSQSYVRDGQRLCIKHREFFQNDNGKKGQKLIS